MKKMRLWLTTVATAIALAAGINASAPSPAAAHAGDPRHSSMSVRLAVGVDGLSSATIHAPRVDAVLIKSAAHNLAMHGNAAQTTDLINQWAAAHS
ncbi:hypothetical protein AB0B68_21410 [Micromonospora sp. NPDC049049]|uniref:hypothetical protein n=1 Tax=Micromonospora sp. NPDC049049 TaxID=3155495 RepID=UPI00340B0332